MHKVILFLIWIYERCHHIWGTCPYGRCPLTGSIPFVYEKCSLMGCVLIREVIFNMEGLLNERRMSPNGRCCLDDDNSHRLRGGVHFWKVSNNGRFALQDVSSFGRCHVMEGLPCGNCLFHSGVNATNLSLMCKAVALFVKSLLL